MQTRSSLSGKLSTGGKLLNILLSIVLIVGLMPALHLAVTPDNAYASAVTSVTVQAKDSAGEVRTLATWTYNSSKVTYIDDATGSELAIAEDWSSDPKVYTGTCNASDPRAMAVATKGITLENLYEYAGNLLNPSKGESILKSSDVTLSLAASDGFSVSGTYSGYWGVTRYSYPAWYNASSNPGSTVSSTYQTGAIEVASCLAIKGYHVKYANDPDTYANTAASLKSSADSYNALRNFQGQVKGGSSSDVNLGNYSSKNISIITFTASKTFDELGVDTSDETVPTGAGTQANPWVITNATQLDAFASDSSYWGSGTYAKLGANITADSAFAGIGSSTAYQGTFDGCGYTVKLAYSKSTSSDYKESHQSMGLFDRASGATIKNVVVSGAVTSNGATWTDYTNCGNGTAGIVGWANGCTISCCRNEAAITFTGTGSAAVAGIVGSASGGANVVDRCANTGAIKMTSTNTSSSYKPSVGGIIGFVNNSGSTKIYDSYNTGTVYGSTGTGSYGNAGGLVGKNYTSSYLTIYNAYSKTTPTRGGTNVDYSSTVGYGSYSSSSKNVGTIVTSTLNAGTHYTGVDAPWSTSATSYPQLAWEVPSTSIANGTATVTPASTTYTGSAITVTSSLSVGGTTLTMGTDYTVTYSAVTNAGTYTQTFTGIGNYSGTITKTFTVSAKSISGGTATVTPASSTYTGSAITVTSSLSVGGTTLTKGTDYTVTYSAVTNAGTYTQTFTGIGNYSGTVSTGFTIAQASFASDNVVVTLPASSYTFTGDAIAPTPTVTFNGITLTSGYTVSYANNTSAGTATVTVTGSGNFTGSKAATFEIVTASMADATVETIADQGFTGSAIEPVPVVTYAGKTLVAGTDYTVSYGTNTDIGTGTVTITSTGTVFTKGTTKTVNFNIVWAAPRLVDGAYQLTWPQDITWFAAQVSAGNTAINVKMTRDIDMTGTAMSMIGDSTNRFAGTFDGDGHALTGIAISTDADKAGLFAETAKTSTIENLTIAGSVTSTATSATTVAQLDGVGALVGVNRGIIKNVISSVTVTADNMYNVGALVGWNSGKVNQWSNASRVTQVITDEVNNGAISACVTTGNVEGGTAVGGIAGHNSGSIDSCMTFGKVDGVNTDSKNGVGGIVGRNGNNNTAYETGTVNACAVFGTVGRTGQKWVGGIVGFCSGTYGNASCTPSSVTNCYMAGTLVSSKTGYDNQIAGGIEGVATNNYAISTSGNTGSTEAEIGIATTLADLKMNAMAYKLNSTDECWAFAADTDAIASILSAKGLTGVLVPAALSSNPVPTQSDISEATVTGISATYAYTGTAIEPVPTVVLGSKTLTQGTDYTVAYANNLTTGTATVTITGAGTCTGEIVKTFKIVCTYTVGDLNCNGRINTVDAQIVLDMANGKFGTGYATLLEKLAAAGTTWDFATAVAAADYNSDETVDALDARAIQSSVFA